MSGPPVVCATRGGEGSRAVRRRAVELAHATERPLVFLSVVDPSALDVPTPGGRALDAALIDELTWLARALLRLADRRARRAGVTPELVLRAGPVREEIARFVEERGAERLLLGAPRGTTANVFGDDAIERFAAEVAVRSGVAVEVVRPEPREAR